MSRQTVIAYLGKKESESKDEAILWFMKNATGPFRLIHIKAKTPYGVILKLHRFCQERRINIKDYDCVKLITSLNFYSSEQLYSNHIEAIIDDDVGYFAEMELGKVEEIKIYE